MSVLQNEKCTNALLLPFIIKNIADLPVVSMYDLSSLKVIFTGGEPLHHSFFVKLRCKLPQCKFFDTYGQTEVMDSASQTYDQDIELCDHNELDILPNHEIKIIDDDLKIVPISDVGEICIRSSYRFLEYIENPDATSQVLSPTGWFHTGDMGFINERGKLVVLGRRCHMIERAMAKIFPAEVEKVLINYPDVVDVAVLGITEVAHDVLCACVVAKKGSQLESSVADFKEWINHQLNSNQRRISMKPNYFHVMEVFPKTKTGKTDRKALRNIIVQKLLDERNNEKP
jgi:acyl-coenzyme A synthetase/AMP-(fatty) acid ligase